jgi:hypothetical protein
LLLLDLFLEELLGHLLSLLLLLSLYSLLCHFPCRIIITILDIFWSPSRNQMKSRRSLRCWMVCGLEPSRVMSLTWCDAPSF